jgi:hypothetical protein
LQIKIKQMDNKKQKKQGFKSTKTSLGYPLAQSISLDKKDTVSYEMRPGKTTMENYGTKADGTPNMIPSTTYTKRVISNKDYADRMSGGVGKAKTGQKAREYSITKTPVKFTNPQADPVTGQVLQPQTIPNRAGAPDRNINQMVGGASVVTPQDPGMQSAQQQQQFGRMQDIAQNMQPPPVSPVMNYSKPALVLDKSGAGVADIGGGVEAPGERQVEEEKKAAAKAREDDMAEQGGIVT